MKYELFCKENDKNKMKLMINFNKTIADIKRGEKAYSKVHEEMEALENEGKQQSLIDESKNPKEIAKKARIKEKKDLLEKYCDAVQKLWTKGSVIAVELEEKFNIRILDHFFKDGINLFEYIPSLKIVDKE